MLTPPVVLISFNRPELTERALARVRAAEPRQLFLIADGPRSGHTDDAERCAAVREVLAAVDWPCEVRQRYSATNRGCGTTVESAWTGSSSASRKRSSSRTTASWAELLPLLRGVAERYRGDDRVAQISGTTLLVPTHLFKGDSYAFGSFAGVWGWAAWGRAWREHREAFPRQHRGPTSEGAVGSVPHRTRRPVLDLPTW